MKYRSLKISLSILLLSAFTALKAQPTVKAYATDLSATLTSQQLGSLNNWLNTYNDTAASQLAVIFTDDLEGKDISSFSFDFGRKNGVGLKEVNNGVVLTVVPKKPGQKGQVFIAPGYGLEGAIPDAVCKRIVENELIPNFKQNNYYAGVQQALTVIGKLAAGEYSGKDYLKKTKGKKGSSFVVVILIIAFWLFMIFGKARRYGRTNNLPLWVALGMMSNSRGHSGSFSNFSGGSGGFGGFGGGGFGGGGAGGSW